MDDLRTCLPGRWMHSQEEDTPEIAVYRPVAYTFPPARGRTGYEFRADGTAVYLGIAAADGSTETPGRWETEGPDTVRVTAEDTAIQPMLLRVLTCDADKLTLSR